MNKELKPLINKLTLFAKNRMGFSNPPRLFLRNDTENSKMMLGKTAFYDPEKKAITLFTSNRHPKDILRSYAHELVHHTQNLRGDFSAHRCGEVGEGYAQNNKHLREMEREAYEKGNMCFRDWEDTLDDKEIYIFKIAESKFLKENKKMTKKITKEFLKKSIRKIIKEQLEQNGTPAHFLQKPPEIPKKKQSNSILSIKPTKKKGVKLVATGTFEEASCGGKSAKRENEKPVEEIVGMATGYAGGKLAGDKIKKIKPRLKKAGEKVVNKGLSKLKKIGDPIDKKIKDTAKDVKDKFKKGADSLNQKIQKLEELEKKKKGKFDDGDDKDEKCDYVDCGDTIDEESAAETAKKVGKPNKTAKEIDKEVKKIGKPKKPANPYGTNESKIQTPEQENTIYEQRFTPKNTRLYEKLVKQWVK